jgi:tungstate transport system ATP-binding protein
LTGHRLALRTVTLERGGRTAIDVSYLGVSAGEVLVVLGPNGAGKSTLVQLMALLLPPASGDVLYDDVPVRDRLACRRRMAVVFQEPLLLDTDVKANVSTGLALRGVGKQERDRRTGEWLGRFGVGALAKRSARLLSGGEAQRVSLARAFALHPEVMFLDEPFSALDAPTRLELVEDLRPLLGTGGMATVFVTHDRTEALRLGDRIAVIMDGRLRQVGAAAEVFGAPADEQVAQFVGVETVIRGCVLSVDQGVAAVDIGGQVIEGGSGVQAGDEVLVCLRPEDIALGPPGQEAVRTSVRNHLPARVTRVTPWGPLLRVELDAGFPVVALITRQSLDDLELRSGSEVSAGFKASAVHLIGMARS